MVNKPKNIFTSKASVLEFLQNNIKKSTIEQLMYFTVEDWKNDQKKILSKIKKSFHSSKIIIVRSSALGEDSFENSYMTDFLQGLIDDGQKLKAIIIENGWLELDNIDDYNLYKKKNLEKEILQFYDPND